VLCSDEWWTALDKGAIERREVEGTITAVYRAPSDRPEFRMRSEDGTAWSGARHGDPTRYVEGLYVRLEYVSVERAADGRSELDTTADVAMAVWIEYSHRRTPLREHSFFPLGIR
jgi:hypothetical protein